MASLKIRVPVEVIVDVDAWNDEYQQNESPSEIRTVVKRNSLDAVSLAFDHLTCVKVREA